MSPLSNHQFPITIGSVTFTENSKYNPDVIANYYDVDNMHHVRMRVPSRFLEALLLKKEEPIETPRYEWEPLPLNYKNVKDISEAISTLERRVEVVVNMFKTTHNRFVTNDSICYKYDGSTEDGFVYIISYAVADLEPVKNHFSRSIEELRTFFKETSGVLVSNKE